MAGERAESCVPRSAGAASFIATPALECGGGSGIPGSASAAGGRGRSGSCSDTDSATAENRARNLQHLVASEHRDVGVDGGVQRQHQLPRRILCFSANVATWLFRMDADIGAPDIEIDVPPVIFLIAFSITSWMASPFGVSQPQYRVRRRNEQAELRARSGLRGIRLCPPSQDRERERRRDRADPLGQAPSTTTPTCNVDAAERGGCGGSATAPIPYPRPLMKPEKPLVIPLFHVSEKYPGASEREVDGPARRPERRSPEPCVG